MDDHLIGIVSNIGVISFVALSAYLLLLTGEISFGQQAFFAIGAYAAALIQLNWTPGGLFAPVLGAVAVVASLAVVAGFLFLRRRGVYFSLLTLAFTAMTFATGTRYLLAEPVEGWKGDDVDTVVESRGTVQYENPFTGAQVGASLTAYVLTYTVLLISYVVVLTHLAGKGSQ